jgi:sugar O-acyltransferase (sialic acid O-acetyltransferase NeuD family)
MKRRVVVFGTNTLASLARHCFVHDAEREVVAFTVDEGYLTGVEMEGLPLVPFERLPEHFPPDMHAVAVPLGYLRMNELRRERVAQARQMGYRVEGFVSHQAIVAAGIRILENVFIYEGCIVQPFVTLGENVILRAGANIGHHSVVGSHAFVASGVTTGGNVTIGKRSFIGVGAVLRDNVAIGERCFVGAGAVVIRNTEPDSVYVGNPARRLDKRSLEVAGE